MDRIILTNQAELQSLIEGIIRKSFQEFSLNIPDHNQDNILTVSEASEYLNLAKQTLYGFTSKNEIPFLKKGKKLYFRKSELQDWLLEGKQKSVSEIRNSFNK